MIGERIIPLLDLRAQNSPIRDEILAEVMRVIDSQQFILGDDVRRLEEEIASYCGAAFAIGCASGSDALFLALLALDIGPGDKVLTTPFTFFATAGAVIRAGATPVFVDVEPGTFNMDMNRVADALSAHPEIRAVIPIHLFGGCADMDPLCALARQRGIAVIEDAAQSIGAEYKGRRAGTMGDIGCFSFYPTKNLGGYGDSGMLTTGNAALAERLTALRVHGEIRRYYHQWIGINSRLDTLQAAVLRVKLKYLDSWTAARQHNAGLYARLLAGGGAPVDCPQPTPYQTRHVYNQFTIRSRRRDPLREHLKRHGVGTEIYYPLPLHLQRCFAELGCRPGDFPVSERLSAEVLSLPIYSELSAEDIEYVCQVIRGFFS